MGGVGDELKAEIMRADHPFGVDLRGTTLEEALAGMGDIGRQKPMSKRGQ